VAGQRALIAHRYTSILSQRVWAPGQGQSTVQRGHRADFMEAARELGIHEPRLYARTRIEVAERLPAQEG